MKREELLPHLNQFMTVTLTDGSCYSGYIVNAKEIQNNLSDDLEVQLINGLLVETMWLSEITEISFPAREETASIPVMKEVTGYKES
ncbi:MAG: hypothetical protein IKE36_03680 [Solobacterium sp.]|jgi:hypothetical protein|nr:hypothetical protein [Solobacterium sp.]